MATVRDSLPIRALSALAAWLKAIFGRVAASERYRPEEHYMRGPGPKSRAKAERNAGKEKR